MRTLLFPLLLALPALARGPYQQGVLADLGCLVLAALGLWFLKGQAGVLCLGQGGFLAAGAYAYALLAARGAPPPLAAVAAVAAAAAVALLVSPAIVRSPIDGAALATLALVIVLQGTATGLRDLTGGASGLRGVLPLVPSRHAAAYLAWGAVAAGLMFLRWFSTTAPGRAVRAARDDPAGAARAGVNVPAARRLALCVCAAFGGLAGAMTGAGFGFISPDMFDIALSISLLVVVVVGGERFLGGPLLGAAFIYFLPDLVRASRDFQTLLNGVLLLLVTLYCPGGMAGVAATVAAAVARRLARAGRQKTRAAPAGKGG